MKKQLLLLVMMLLPMMVMADAVEIDGIYYNLITKGNVAEVTSNPNRYNGEITIPSSITYQGKNYNVTSIGDYAFSGSGITSLYIPNSVTSIGNSAFNSCGSLSSINIPNSVTFIDNLAFSDCTNLSAISLPNSVTSLGNSAFSGCTNLKSINIPNTINAIGNSTFRGCTAINSISIPNSIATIGEYAFYDCKSLMTINIPNSVSIIDSYVFYGCSSLTSINIPNSVTSIGYRAFRECSNLESLTIPSSVTSIDRGAFEMCSSLSSIEMSNGIITIGTSAFANCTNLSSVSIPRSVTIIVANAFNGCSSLKSVTIGSGIETIGNYVFANCPELKDVYIHAESVPNTNSNTFEGSYIEFATLHVPDASLAAYSNTAPWSQFGTKVGMSGSTQTQKCAKPSIIYQNGQLKMSCATEDAQFVTDITDTDIKKHYDATIQLTATYNISVYATKSGYENSDVATVILCWIDQAPSITTGSLQVPALPVLIQSNGGQLTVEGLDDGTQVNVYGINGTEAGSAVSSNGQAMVNTSLQPDSVAIVKIGTKSVKVVVK